MVTFSLFLLRISLIYSTFAIDMKTNSPFVYPCRYENKLPLNHFLSI